MSALIAYAIIGIITMTGLMIDRLDDNRFDFDSDSVSDWLAMTIAVVGLTVLWPTLYTRHTMYSDVTADTN